jgi:hypothetical protein
MPKYEIEYRVVEIHCYEVEANSEDEAIDACWDLDPFHIETICAELEDVKDISPVAEAQQLLEEIKEDIAELKTELTDKEYYDLRGKNIEYLTGTEK